MEAELSGLPPVRQHFPYTKTILAALGWPPTDPSATLRAYFKARSQPQHSFFEMDTANALPSTEMNIVNAPPPTESPSDQKSPSADNPSASAVTTELEQIGGGRRAPSPPGVQTPTRLRTTVKATNRDVGLIREAGARRSRLLEEVQSTLQGIPPNRIPTSTAIGYQSGDPGNNVAGQDHEGDNDPASTGVVGQCTSSDPFLSQPNPIDEVVSAHDSATNQQATSLIDIARRARAKLSAHRQKEISPSIKLIKKPSDTQAGADTSQQSASTDVTPRASTSQNPSAYALVPPVAVLDEPAQMEADIRYPLDAPSPPSQIPNEGNDDNPFLFDEHANIQSSDEQSSVTLGRTSGTVLSVLEDGFEEIHSQFTDLAGRVGMPLHQVIGRFSKQFSTRTNNFNGWNRYQSFYATHRAQELARLAEADLVTATPSQRMTLCYKKFREDYPDTWQTILTKFEEAETLGNPDKTLAQRQSLFRKLTKDLDQRFSSIAKAHAFEGVFIMAGGVVNQDGGLGHIFATPGAVDFFLECCCVDNHDMLGHFKAHVYHKMSLANLPPALGPSNATAEQKGSLSKAAISTKEEEGCRSKEPVCQSKQTEVEEVDLEVMVEVSGTEERENHSQVRSALVEALKKVGCKWATGKLFPWKALPGKLARSGIVCYNFPDTVPFPGEDRQTRPKTGSKGISELTLAECSTLLAALNDPPAQQLHFKKEPESKAALMASRTPVIHGAAPSYDSSFPCAKRMFANMICDRNGVPRKSVNVATRMKKRPVPSTPCQPDSISIPDSDDTPVRPATKTRPPSTHESDGIEILSGPPDSAKTQVHTHNSARVVVTRSRATKFTKDARAQSSDAEDAPGDISSPSGSDYQPEIVEDDAPTESIEGMDVDSDENEYEQESSSRKRKSSRMDISSRTTKRRLVSTRFTTSAKGKGKAKAKGSMPPKYPRISSPAASSEDENAGAVLPVTAKVVVNVVNDDLLHEKDVGPSLVAQNSDITPQRTLPFIGPVSAASNLDTAAKSSQPPPTPPPVSAPLQSGSTSAAAPRPRPRLVTKDKGRDPNEDMVDPFSLRKRKGVALNPCVVEKEKAPFPDETTLQQPPRDVLLPPPFAESAPDDSNHASCEASRLPVLPRQPQLAAVPAKLMTPSVNSGSTEVSPSTKLVAAEEGRVSELPDGAASCDPFPPNAQGAPQGFQGGPLPTTGLQGGPPAPQQEGMNWYPHVMDPRLRSFPFQYGPAMMNPYAYWPGGPYPAAGEAKPTSASTASSSSPHGDPQAPGAYNGGLMPYNMLPGPYYYPTPPNIHFPPPPQNSSQLPGMHRLPHDGSADGTTAQLKQPPAAPGDTPDRDLK